METDKALYQYQQGRLARRLREETDDLLSKQEELAINSVMQKLNSGEPLDPQFAVQQWLALHAVRKFARALRQKEKGAASAAGKLGGDLT